MKAILGIKKGMTRIFEGDRVIPVTIVDVTGCKVAKKSPTQVEIGLGENKKANKATVGQYKKLKLAPKYTKVFSGEFELEEGSEILPELFNEGDVVEVEGISKGKGFAGVVKRYRFAGGPRTRGQSDRLRAPGSIGAGASPGRVFKGLRMGGRMGSDTVTIKNKKIVGIKEGYLLVSGPIPGSNGDLVAIFSK